MHVRSGIIATLLAMVATGCSTTPDRGIVTGSLPAVSLPSLPAVSALLPSLPTSRARTGPERIGSNLYRVSTEGPRIADPIQRENYALLRAAESTRELGSTHFVVVETGNRSGMQTSGLAGSADPGLLIRVFEMTPGAEPPIGAIDAAEIVQFFGPNFGRERTTSAPAH
jgi:hypothetical protein